MEKFTTLEDFQHLLETYGFASNIMSEQLWNAFRAQQITSIYEIFGKWMRVKKSRQEFNTWLLEIYPNGTETERNDLISFLEQKTRLM